MQKAKTTARKRIRKLVREYIQAERCLYKLAITLKSLYGLRSDVRKAYFDATIRTPEQAADAMWTYLADGDQLADFLDRSLMDLHADATLFHVAEAILSYCNEKGWTEQLQAVLSEDAKELLAQRNTRSASLVKLYKANEQHV